MLVFMFGIASAAILGLNPLQSLKVCDSLAKVNDDFCDCADGSDEPGTNACPNSQFYCENAGYKSIVLSGNFVNDGICDCCDGSDEYLGRIKCENTCKQVGIEYRKELKRSEEKRVQGAKIRLNLREKAKNIKQSKLEQIKSEKLEIQKLEKKKKELKSKVESGLFYEQEKRELEEKRHANSYKGRIERLENELEEKYRDLHQLKISLGNLYKRAKLAVESKSTNKDKSQEEEDITVSSESENNDQNEAETNLKDAVLLEHRKILNDIDYNLELVEQFREPSKVEEVPPEKLCDDLSAGFMDCLLETTKFFLKESKLWPRNIFDWNGWPKLKNSLMFSSQISIEDSKIAQQESDSIDNEIRGYEKKITDIKDSLNKSYGEDDEWIALKDQCFSIETNEYTYSICLFDKVEQKDKRYSTKVSLGKFTSFDVVSNAMKYENGQACWNGPIRSSHIEFECAEETAVISSSEPNPCEYRFKMTTPLVCELNA